MNMKSRLTLLFFILIFTACKAKDKTNNAGIEAAAAVKSENVGSQSEVSIRPSAYSTTAGDPDLDLTKMSATMIYSTIFDMLIMPEDYIEKNIKVKGWFETYTDPNTSEMYYAVIVPDATACCQQGLEFVWPGEHTYPQDFPTPGEDVTITGRYKLIENDGVTYTYLEANSVEF